MRFTSVSGTGHYRFPLNTFDVRGFGVRSALDGESIGRVADLLVDEQGGPRYLDVELGRTKHVLVPLGQARVDAREDLIWVDGLARDQFGRVPDYAGDPREVNAAYERRLAQTFRELRLSAAAAARQGAADATADVAAPAPDSERRKLDRFYGSRQRPDAQRTQVPEAAAGPGAESEVHIRLSDDEIIIERDPRSD